MDKVKIIIGEVEKLKSEKEFKKALQLLENSLLTYSDDYRLYEEIADIYLFQGKITKSRKAIDFALNINPDSATGNYLKGFILLSRGKIKESIEHLEKSNFLSSNNPEVLRNLGWAYSLVGKSEKGIYMLKRSLNLSPDDKLIIEDLAIALISSGKLEEGNILLEKIGKNGIKTN